MKTMSANVKLGNNPFIKAIPLIAKKAIVRLSYIEIRKMPTIKMKMDSLEEPNLMTNC